MCGIPLVIAYYWRDHACFVTVSINKHAKMVWKHLGIYTERQFVETLYKLRNVPFPSWVSRRCNNALPMNLLRIKQKRQARRVAKSA
jgi:hypothetical protein